MGSEESWDLPESHKLCANGCGFFGTAATLNLCSKCYRDSKINEEQEAKAKAAVEKSLNPPVPKAKALNQDSFSVSVVPAVAGDLTGVSQPAASSSSPAVDSGTVKNRCLCCNKRIGLTGFKCRCGSTFCSTHRYPEAHKCDFDFKGLGRDSIAKANPVVKADKVDRI